MSAHKLSSRGHEQHWPAPYKDDQGRWWFYDPEMGWECKELAEERAKQMEIIVEPVLNGKRIGRIFLTSTTESFNNDHSGFKKLWEDLK